MKKSLNKETICIIGNGAAGISAAMEIVERKKGCRIFIFSKEKTPYYYRPGILHFFSEKLTQKELIVFPNTHYLNSGIKIVNKSIIEIDVKNQILSDEKGKKYEYDKLVLATGSNPVNIFSKDDLKEKIITIRTLNDCLFLKDRLKNCKEITILGTGFLGIELAEAIIRKINIKVTVIGREPYLLSRYIPSSVSSMFLEKLKSYGINFIFNNTIKNVNRDNNLLKIVLSDKREITCDLLFESIGIQAETTLAGSSGVEVNKGILVDENLSTSVENIWGAGDCAEVKTHELNHNYTSGFFSDANIQGRIAGANISGAHAFFFPRMSTISAMIGRAIFTQTGLMEKTLKNQYFLESTIENGKYKKILFEDDIIIGARFAGDNREFKLVFELIKTRKKMNTRFLSILKQKNCDFFKSMDYL